MEELYEGSALSEVEYQILLAIFEERLLSGDMDADYFPGYAIKEVKETDGSSKWVIVQRTGYSFTEISTWISGVYSSREEALKSVTRD